MMNHEELRRTWDIKSWHPQHPHPRLDVVGLDLILRSDLSIRRGLGHEFDMDGPAHQDG